MTDEPTMTDTLAAEFDRMQGMTDDELEAPKARDEKGRFASTKEAPADEPTEIDAVEPAPAEEELPDQGDVPPAEPRPEPLSPPERWSAEWKTKFTALPRDAQQLLIDREGEYNKGFTQTAQEAANLKRQIEPIQSLIEPRRQRWALQGMSPEQALGQIVALEEFATQDPARFIQWFAQQRGVDLNQIAAPQSGEAPPAQAPNLIPVINDIQAIKQQLAAAEQAQLNQQFDAFRSTHEHFDEVRVYMGKLLEGGLAPDMEEAYGMACRANPTVYAKLQAADRAKQEATRQAAEAKRLEEQRQAAAKAKKAAGTQLSTRASLPSGAPAPTDMREGMLAEYDRMMGVG